jgi:transposase
LLSGILRPSLYPQDLQHIQGEVKERYQVHDLPELRLEVEEHQVVEICCPHCQARSRGSFPTTVRAAARYGPRVQALAVYLSQFQLLPMMRVCETLSDLCHCGLSEGTLLNWIEQATHTLEPTQQRIKMLLVRSKLFHADETGVRMIKVQQKISGTFRNADGATAFCVIRSYLSAMRKQGRSMLAALAAVFHGAPLPVAWGPE